MEKNFLFEDEIRRMNDDFFFFFRTLQEKYIYKSSLASKILIKKILYNTSKTFLVDLQKEDRLINIHLENASIFFRTYKSKNSGRRFD